MHFQPPDGFHTTDFSHLPPSPSSSSIQQFLQHATSAANSAVTALRPSSEMHPAFRKRAHSLLRGTQEGWSGMDDEATAEALRKLDGLSGKGARTRASVGVSVGPPSLSRPGTPAKVGKGPQWKGSRVARQSRRECHTKESVSGRKIKIPKKFHLLVLGSRTSCRNLNLLAVAIAAVTTNNPHPLPL